MNHRNVKPITGRIICQPNEKQHAITSSSTKRLHVTLLDGSIHHVTRIWALELIKTKLVFPLPLVSSLTLGKRKIQIAKIQ